MNSRKGIVTPKTKWLKFGIIFFYLLLFTRLALYDERPNPEMVQEMARPRPETVEPGNAWIAFLGFESRQGVSPYARGAEMMRKLQDSVSTGRNLNEPLIFTDNKANLAFHGKLPPFYSEKTGGMLEYATAHPDEVAALLRNNRELLERYESLRSYTRYTEPLDYGFYTPIPRFSLLRNAQKTSSYN
jgi:hypothetical protein